MDTLVAVARQYPGNIELVKHVLQVGVVLLKGVKQSAGEAQDGRLLCREDSKGRQGRSSKRSRPNTAKVRLGGDSR